MRNKNVTISSGKGRYVLNYENGALVPHISKPLGKPIPPVRNIAPIQSVQQQSDGDGTSLGTLAFNETPVGAINGSNSTFVLEKIPVDLMLFKNGMLQRAGSDNDYVLSGKTIVFVAGNIPQSGDVLLATYAHEI